MSLDKRFAAAGLDWIVPAWNAPDDVHGFMTTRDGGAPAEAFLPSPPIRLEQVHGNAVASIDARNLDAARARPPIADAAVTRLADVPLAVRVADCLPILLADDPGGVVAVAHAGWRGLAAGVLEATVAAMQVDPHSLVAWLGPAIGPRAFEVGDDVRDAFCGTDGGALAHFVPYAEGKWLADLPALARRRLAAANVARVAGGDQCTWSDASRFFSYRRDRTSARMAAFVWRSAR